MELTISTDGDEQALEQLYHWLRQDVDVVRSAKVGTTSAPGAGHMGAVEVICMSIGSLTGLANLGVAWASFLRSRNAAPPVRFTVVGPLSDEQLALLTSMNLPMGPGDDDE
ncbi:effector-associated constant component EACC1 [Amycolatopsis sp. cmx-4-68]|uniref:effector-associated constant component EACC1 n=1 Tax=Amycolatopsis sp. cmx-4-68 TaxID=2790938 RepID=UPI00397D6EE6